MSFGLVARGYNPRQVDDVLDYIATALEHGETVDPNAFLTSFESVAAGYSGEEVDQYLAAILQELQRRADSAATVSAQCADNPAIDEAEESGEFSPSSLAQAAVLLVTGSVIKAQWCRRARPDWQSPSACSFATAR